MLQSKPDFIQNNSFIDGLYDQIESDPKPRKTIRVLHFSDIHIDFNYETGMSTVCDYPTCCRRVNGEAKSWEESAGAWGDFMCDLPVETAELLFMYIRNMQPDKKPEMIIWTGDNTPHDYWNQTQQLCIDYTLKITGFMQEHIPDIPVLPVPGNHEYFPVSVSEFDDDEDPVLH